VLEHINGKSLRDRTLAGQRLEGENLIQLIEQMCGILGYLTSLTPQIVHRDFTPDNLLVGNDGILKLIDFSVAHDKQGSSTATVVGKHAYLPPEQFRGQPSPRSDIYAMGCTLYFLLTGLDPEPLTQSSFEQATTPAETILSGIIYNCTALDENERFQTVDEILPLLKQAMKYLKDANSLQDLNETVPYNEKKSDEATVAGSQSIKSISYSLEVSGATLKTDERETICMSKEV
jgi:serine/threonine-protein kinase